MITTKKLFAWAAVGLLIGTASNSVQAITITMDGITSPTQLSDAVDTAMTTDDGPDIINITTDTLATADRAIFINKPITINGDADNNGVQADVLVDMATLRQITTPDIGIIGYKSYIEIQSAGSVIINNMRIHPNNEGAFAAFADAPLMAVGGIRIFKPANAGDTLTLELNKVWVGGSKGPNHNYVSIASGEDLYNDGKRWGGQTGTNDGNLGKYSVINFSEDAIGQGAVNAILDHCQAGMSRGCALTIAGSNVNVQVLGGVFGHSARDAIRVADSATATFKGTLEDRIRVVRYTNITAANSHGLEVLGGATVPLIEYVDFAGLQSGNALSLREGTINEVNSVRSLGKYLVSGTGTVAPLNEALYVTTADNDIDLIRNSTFHGVNHNVVHVTGSVVNPIEMRDCIFTANEVSRSVNINTTATVSFVNCALPSDALAGESLTNPAIIGSGVYTTSGTVSASPQYMLTLADYDWSDDQGASNPLNGPGNRNVLRPALANAAYATASSTSGRLTGGAGPDASSINEWMMY